MELKVTSPKIGLSPASDPEEKEISEDDDDDRNHKHRRREARSQSLEGDASEQVLTRPYRKRKPFENGHPCRESGSQSSETWKTYNFGNQERDSSGRFEKRRPNLASFSRAPTELSQRIRLNQSLSADPGPTRGRGRESGAWGQRDSRFSSADIASQLVQQGSIPPSLFAGRGLPNVSNVQSATWNAFGLVPAMPNGGLDTLHSIGLQGALKPSINPTVNLGISRPRCRDFEERGFCLRGDMCPMEHGVNRIVVEDVQSLSQFNLPVSLPSAHLLGTPAGQGPLPANSSSGAFMNSKCLQSKNSKPGIGDDGLGLNGAFVGGSMAGGSDLYDPDQPLWASDCPDTSPELLALNPSNLDKVEPLVDADCSDRLSVGQFDGSDNERPARNAGAVTGCQSSSVWGRIGSSRNRGDVREKIGSTLNSPSHLENEAKKDMESINGAEAIALHGRRTKADEVGMQVLGLSSKPHGDSGRSIRKPSQKALRTLFVSGVPQKENKREALLLHFQKFGEVIDIYIPSNSERAFVQFSKREEAEAALKAPDAVMGNRFIKLWWANRDSIPDDGTGGVGNIHANPRGVTFTGGPTYPSVTTKGKDNIQISGSKSSIANSAISPLPGSDHPKPVATNGPKAVPPLQKKLESLELLKEQVRKKQEMLDQKRNEFKRQLNKLEKQATGLKEEVALDQPSKGQKGGMVVDVAKIEMLRPSDSGTAISSPQADTTMDSGRAGESAVARSPKINSTIALPESSILKPSIRPLAPLGAPMVINRFKLDNRPTAFKILPPLPAGLANVSNLKEHFSVFGDLSVVELEDTKPQDGDNESEASKVSGRISFTTRRSAEKAFLHGKCWQGQNLQFGWLSCSSTSRDNSGKEHPCASSKWSSDATVQSAGEVEIQAANTLGNAESQNLKLKASDAEHVDRDEDLESTSTMVSGGKNSP
ncbi:zinc finger CCCH domain-containing protein 41 [Coffea arabica]|uniref:Zinc finger CCCH domain-containing protein 41 n=1 Tax=Coffea arabica TaxID=13443 RepID=A0A6P6TA07_COFAR|nr:zinc finger CCCH domain-containing protein 41-like [Coffea arabica]